MAAALRGIKVLDLSRLLPGPYATQILADMGATVIKVENAASGGDPLRFYPPLCADGTSAMFHAINRGKRSVAFDFKDLDATRSHLHDLMRTCDVLVESFRPGTLERMLGVSELSEVTKDHTNLVIARISGYGTRNEGVGHDLNFMAASGALGLMREPATLPVQVADFGAGAWPAATQIIAALYARDVQQNQGDHPTTPGEGCIIDVNLTAGARSMLVLPLARHACSGEDVDRGKDLLTGSHPSYTVFDAADGSYLAVGTLEAHFFKRLCAAVLGEAAGAGGGEAGGSGHLRDALAGVIRTKTAREWEEMLAGKDIPVTAIEDPQVDRGFLEPVSVPLGLDPAESPRHTKPRDDELEVLPTPLDRAVAVERGQLARCAPKLGEGNEDFLGSGCDGSGGSTEGPR